LVWRLLPWLVPFALILVGLVFITVGVTDDEPGDAPDRDATPATVSTVFANNAQAWAESQVGAGITTVIAEVMPIGAAATGASTYTARAVIVRRDAVAQPPAVAGGTVAPLAEADTSTVATCVLWDVDAAAGSYVPRAAVELVRIVGHREIDGLDAVGNQCKDATLPS